MIENDSATIDTFGGEPFISSRMLADLCVNALMVLSTYVGAVIKHIRAGEVGQSCKTAILTSLAARCDVASLKP